MKKIIIITGGAKGLGFYLTKGFVESGNIVIVISRDRKALKLCSEKLKLCKGKVITYTCDVRSYAKVSNVIKKIVKRFKQIDVLINNAGVMAPVGAFDKLDMKEILNNIDVNLLGPVNTMHNVLRHMKYLKKGKIINISGGGAVKPLKELALYSATKTALVRLSETLAHEYLDYNIQINCIAPGFLNTKIHEQLFSCDIVSREIKNDFKNKLKTHTDDPNLTFKLCKYLVSEKSNNITGKLISSIYDNWSNEEFKLDDSIFTLRRIDNTFFKKA